MLVGQYSVGKTSFIRYLLGRDFPGMNIGPEPTTDRFFAVMSGPDERIIPGNTLSVSHDLPYRGLERFGVAFLNRFEGAQLPSEVLKNITLIDTPGVLSGEKQRVARGYDFCSVISWFAARADLILMLFDAHKLDISDEFKNVIEALKGNDDKIRCVLNKADQVDRQKLMRVYGALMWSLGKVIPTPEVCRVYLGSFWDQPLVHKDNAELFKMEERDLLRDLKDLPRNSAVRKINELVKRVRLCKVHAYIISYLKEQMPSIYGHKKEQEKLCNTLPAVFKAVLRRNNLAPGDFPDIEDFGLKLREQDFSKFHSLKQKLIDQVDTVLSSDIPRLLDALPQALDMSDPVVIKNQPLVFDKIQYAQPEPVLAVAEASNPFAVAEIMPLAPPTKTVKPSSTPVSWALQAELPKYQPKFMELQIDGYVSGASARTVMQATGLPVALLKQVWNLADIDKDGQLDIHEYVIANHLCQVLLEGGACPSVLATAWVPPQKR